MERHSHAQVLRGVGEFLNLHGVSFASLIIDVLRDQKSLLAGGLISRIADVLEALRPNLNTGSTIELGQFFASIASSELSELRKHELWYLLATTLSAEELKGFSVAEMSQHIAALAPGFSSFLHSVCIGKKRLLSIMVSDSGTTD